MTENNLLISSGSNPRVKHLQKLLQDKKYRYENQEFIVEGKTLVNCAKNIKEIYTLPDSADYKNIKTYLLEKKVFDKISSVENPQGIMAVCGMSVNKIKNTGKYILLDGLQDPGNLGTILRSAAGFDYQGAIFMPNCVDPYSPKVVRSTMGAIFSLDLIFIDNPAELSGHQIIAADGSGQLLNTIQPQPNHILVIGRESRGISAEILKLADAIAAIPISPKMESYNAAVAAGIIMYELNSKLSTK